MPQTAAITAAALLQAATVFGGEGGVREIPVPSLDDVAVATVDEQGPVILYSPERCRTLGRTLCAFFREHEYGHHALGHFRDDGMPRSANAAETRALERAADCYAARRMSFSQAERVAAFFRRAQGERRAGEAYPRGAQRADTVLNCARRGV